MKTGFTIGARCIYDPPLDKGEELYKGKEGSAWPTALEARKYLDSIGWKLTLIDGAIVPAGLYSIAMPDEYHKCVDNTGDYVRVSHAPLNVRCQILERVEDRMSPEMYQIAEEFEEGDLLDEEQLEELRLWSFEGIEGDMQAWMADKPHQVVRRLLAQIAKQRIELDELRAFKDDVIASQEQYYL